ncbi:MAG: cysteine desulfurase, partial [Thermoplasmata archaeon]|nr:cysteine desulfurase [Thermoplasmata archaeon]
MMATTIEHMSILNPLKSLTKRGFTMELVPVDEYGMVDLDKLRDMISPETVIMSVMHANNEIGTIQPIKEISQIVHEKGMYLHVDATASAGKIPIDVQDMGIDLLTLSSNDLGGPQGAGALYIKTGTRIQTIMPGGGQERGLRSGTENIFAIAGMGEAARFAKEDMPAESPRLQSIRDQLISEILKNDNTYLTGHPEKRLPHHASFRFSFIEGESILLMMDFQGVQISTGSACSSKTLEASHVLLAIGLTHEQAHGSMVLTLGRDNRPEEVPVVVSATKNTIEKLRMLSPITQEGEEYPEEEH